jgi:death on curing protein
MEYPTADEIHALHERIVAHNSNTESGTRNAAAIESALTYISSGYFGHAPESIHAKAAHLMRLIAADHPYVDGNKRTALSAAAYLYHLNGYDLIVDDQIRYHLRAFAMDAAAVDIDEVVDYLREHATEQQ